MSALAVIIIRLFFSRKSFSNYPVFALAKNLGEIQSLSDPVVFALGHVRDPVIQVKTPQGENPENRYLYYKVKYNNTGDGVSVSRYLVRSYADKIAARL